MGFSENFIEVFSASKYNYGKACYVDACAIVCIEPCESGSKIIYSTAGPMRFLDVIEDPKTVLDKMKEINHPLDISNSDGNVGMPAEE